MIHAPLEAAAAILGLLFLAIGMAEIGRRLHDLLDRAFGDQMQDQFPGEGAALPRPDDAQALRDKGAL